MYWQVRVVLLLFTIRCSLFTSYAQDKHPWEEPLNEVMTLEDAVTTAWEETYELLCDLELHPMNLNSVTREQLEQLPFLTAQQVEDIMAYLYQYGPMKSEAELMMNL